MFQRGKQTGAGFCIETADILRHPVGQLDGPFMRLAGIDGRFGCEIAASCFKFLGVIPDQPQPDTDLVDEGSDGWPRRPVSRAEI